MPEVNDDQTPRPETTCGRCGQPKPDDGDDWCRRCENENAAEVVAAMEPRPDVGAWISGPGLSEQVRAVNLDAGDVIILDGRKVIVEHVRPYGSGWVITWHAGTASGVHSIDWGELVTRVSAFVTGGETDA
jgi:hypothetical protein